MKVFNVATSILLFLAFSPTAYAGTIINLNDFFADPTVTVAVDGKSAILSEDPLIAPVILSNDPFLGDPFVIDISMGPILSFDFDFIEPAFNDDEFFAFVIDSSGFSAGPAFEFFTDSTSTGSVSFDLTPLAGEPFLGLQFQLNSFDFAFDSTVTVSNVMLSPVQGVIPEPSSFAIWGLLVGVTGVTRRRRNKGVRSLCLRRT